jgi:poly(3-hydroxybutyrate) depolymerase
MKYFNHKFLFAVLSIFLITICPSKAEVVQIQVGSTLRSMIVYAPSGIPANRPLLINLHGLNQDAAYQQAQAKWETIADAEKFVVVYPSGINNSWDLSGTSDTDFILAIINNMSSRYSIDRNRVYLSGFSMGGMMTYYAATKIADKIAAFAPVSGYLMGGPNTNSSRPIPIIHTHGTADNVVPYSGVQTCLNAWITRNGCPTTAQVTDPYPASNPNSTAAKSYWGPGTNGVEIVLMTLKGKGHWWSLDPANSISTSAEIWNFCKKYSLSSCSATAITPYIQVNGGTWQQTASATVNSGTTVVLGPQPSSGGSWSWSGGGTSGSSRQQTINPTSSLTATATYTNSCGATSTQTFTVTVNGSTTGLVNNGIYTIEFQTDATKVLDLLNGTDADGTAIRPWTKNGATAQQWVAVSAGTGYWRFITNVSSSNRCIDLSGGNTANGTAIRLWSNYNNDAQAWQVTEVGGGYYKIVSKLNTSRGFDVSNCVVDGTKNLQLWDYYGTSCQLFKFNYIRTKSARDNENVKTEPLLGIYPNPSSNGDFNVSIPDSETENFQLCIFNIEGKKVFEQNNLKKGNNFISSGLAKGMYIIKTNCSKSITTEKIIIQ